MAAVDTLSPVDKEFLAECEVEFKDRFTEKDEEFMKVFKAEPSTPPIVESWWIPQNSGRRNDRPNNRRQHPYERQGHRDRNYKDRRDNYERRENYDRRDNYERRGYNDYGRDDRGQGYRNQSRY